MATTATAVASRRPTPLARSLKVLIPLIQHDLESGDRAAMAHYADAGAKLLEAKTQLAHGAWGRWLSRNFGLTDRTARQYMRLARIREAQQNGSGASVLPSSLREMAGQTESRRKRRAHESPLRAALGGVRPDVYTLAKQSHAEEVRLHRAVALEMIDVGYRALASRLHPDRGGSGAAMVRLNVVRDELKGLATTRSFV